MANSDEITPFDDVPWRERVRCIATAFNQSLGLSVGEMMLFEAPERAIAVQIVRLRPEGDSQAILPETTRFGGRKSGWVSVSALSGKTAELSSAVRQIAMFERKLGSEQVHFIDVVCIADGSSREICIVHGLSLEPAADLLREDMELILAKMQTPRI